MTLSLYGNTAVLSPVSFLHKNFIMLGREGQHSFSYPILVCSLFILMLTDDVHHVR